MFRLSELPFVEAELAHDASAHPLVALDGDVGWPRTSPQRLADPLASLKVVGEDDGRQGRHGVLSLPTAVVFTRGAISCQL